MRKALVIGGAGYIGSHTCKCLAENDFDTVVFDNFSEGHREFVKWGDFVEGDIKDRIGLNEAIKAHKPSVIVHFAAHAYVSESVSDPGKYYDNNVLGTLNVAMAARDNGSIPIVFSSSCATYGEPNVKLISEGQQQNPINPYGRTKLVAEGILADFTSAYGLPHVSLRYFNACGADASGEIGEKHRIETHLVPRAILSALGRIDDFSIYGTDYPTPDGTAVRDLVHVSDLAHAHVLACKFLLGGGQMDQFNIGAGRGISVLEVVKAVEAASGGKVPLAIADRRDGDPAILVADTAKAKRQLGFSPQHSDLNNIVETALRWHQANP